MRLSIGWLRDYVEIPVGGEELARRLTESLTETICLGSPGAAIEGIVAARVVAVDVHPGADNLSVCVVDWGGGSSTVVCGAPNTRPGMAAVLALPGATLARGLRISERTIRGRRSHGMLVSAAELGLEDASEGLIELPDGVEPGSDVRPILGLDDEIIELEVQPNRPDCLGVIGVAREVAAALGGALRLPSINLKEDGIDISEIARVSIDDPEACPRYLARAVVGLTVGRSPLWIETRLRGAGVRSISNIVDVSNFVMLEYGHPVHAFDLDTLTDRRISVRRARPGEEIVTIDGARRALAPSHLLICDGERPIALAGIMGGRETEVSERTANVLLECAWFDPVVVRRGARSLGMRTEASIRFERGVDPSFMDDVAARACALMAALGGGRVACGSADVGRRGAPHHRIRLRIERARRLLGMDIEPEAVTAHLLALGFDVAGGDGGVLDVGVPSHRRDVEIEADLIEEVGRIEGFGRAPALVPFHSLEPSAEGPHLRRASVRDALTGLGLTEVLTSSFMRPRSAEIVGGGRMEEPVRLVNPVNKETPLLRTTMIPGILDVIRHNRNVGESDIRVFEIGKLFGTAGGEHSEGWWVAGALTGAGDRLSWDRPARSVDFFDGKGLLWPLAEALDVDTPELACYDEPPFDDGAGARCVLSGRDLGVFGMVSREVLGAWNLDRPTFVYELNLDTLCELMTASGGFEPLPRYPRVRRDVALVVSEATRAGEMLDVIQRLEEPLLKDAQVFDVYRDERLGSGRKSLAFALVYMSSDRTLTDREVDGAHARIVGALIEAFGATLRE